MESPQRTKTRTMKFFKIFIKDVLKLQMVGQIPKNPQNGQKQKEMERIGQKLTPTDRNGEKGKETERKGKKWTETDRNGQKQTETDKMK